MTISGVNSTNSAVSTTSTSSTSGAGDQVNNPLSNLGKDDFLQMLITKLKYQDPTSPVDDNSFVADMAQFSSLEQMSNMNTNFSTTNDSLSSLNTNIIGLMMMQNTTQAASLIGKTVAVGITATDASGNQTPQTITGTVSVVRFVNGLPKIVVNGTEYDLSAIQEIKA